MTMTAHPKASETLQDVEPSEVVLDIRDLSVQFTTSHGVVTAVQNINLSLRRGQVFGLVGESGCGKSVTSLAIMRLLPKLGARISSGTITLAGEELTSVSERRMRAIRGKRIAMIFQEPMTSLNPAFTIGNQLSEPLKLHMGMSHKQARRRSVELLELVGIPRPAQVVSDYPHQLSGGMRQRVMIAMAMACEPDVIIADEPTTALDVTIQAQVLELISTLRETRGTTILLITHDLGVVAETCDEVAVMYAGQMVEHADVATLFKHPEHPYTRGLLASLPSLNVGKSELPLIPGSVPETGAMMPGCRFAPRCSQRFEECTTHPIPMFEQGGHQVRCLLYQENR